MKLKYPVILSVFVALASTSAWAIDIYKCSPSYENGTGNPASIGRVQIVINRKSEFASVNIKFINKWPDGAYNAKKMGDFQGGYTLTFKAGQISLWSSRSNDGAVQYHAGTIIFEGGVTTLACSATSDELK